MACAAANATDRIIDYTFALGGPIMKDKLWFFTAARYFSVNNFIANTFFDDGSPGVDDQYIRSGMARLTWQVSPRNKISAYFDEIDKYRGHDMQSLVDPETASWQWFSPAYHTTTVKWSSPLTSKLFLEAGWSSNLEYYTNSYQDGVEEPRGTAAWFAKASRNDLDLGNTNIAPTSRLTESPARYAVSGSATYLLGQHSIKFGMQSTWGSYTHTRDANADLVQQYRSTTTGVPFTVPDSVLIRNTPLTYGERLNYDMGFYVQDSWTINRLTVNAGLRYEKLKAQVLAAESPAGRFVPERNFERDREPAELERLRATPGAGLRPVRQRQDGAQVLAQPLQPGEDDGYRLATTTRCSVRRRRCSGETSTATTSPRANAAATTEPRARRLRDQLRGVAVELRHRGAGHLRRLSAHLEPRKRP